MTTSKAIKLLRKSCNNSQQAFATRLGISMSGLVNYERDRNPEPRMLIPIIRLAKTMRMLHLLPVFTEALQLALNLSPTEAEMFVSAIGRAKED